MLKNFFVLSAFSFLLTLGFVADAQACTCTNTFRPVIIDYEKADAVFTGEIVSVKDIPGKDQENAIEPSDLSVTYKVTKKYKGLPESIKLVTLNADYEASSCGFAVDRKPKPKIGQKWVVFANSLGNARQLWLTGTCGKSRVLASDTEVSEYQGKLSSLNTLPGLTLALVNSDDNRLFKPDNIFIEGNGVKRSGKIDGDGVYHFPDLKKGKYTVSIHLPFFAEPVNLSESIDISSKAQKDEATGKFRTTMTYQIDFAGDAYHYNEIGLFIHR